MRDLIFMDCGPEAAQQAELWAGGALARAGVPEAEAAAAAARLAEGVRLSFELVADGRLPRNAACACGKGAWTPADRAAAGDGAVRLTMAAVA